MLICPSCKFENPDSNKFCQNCGTSLAQKVCSECGTLVETNVQRCDNCGADCGSYWWVIISKVAGVIAKVKDDSNNNDKDNTPEQSAIPSSPHSPLSTPHSKTLPQAWEVGSFLDSQQRYRLLEPLPSVEEFVEKTELCFRVLDCQPFQVSPLAVALANQPEFSVNSLNSLRGISGIPSSALPYIALQGLCHLGIPLIHDAWLDGDLQVVLIEDRSQWQLLLHLWQDDSTTSLQILHCFYQMTQLWEVLEKVNCRQSLMDLANLRLDEDQAVMLHRLYADSLVVANTAENLPPVEGEVTEGRITEGEITTPDYGQILTVQALGRIWQGLFRYSQRTQFGSLVQLLGDLEIGKIQTTSELRSRLGEIGVELQVDVPSCESTNIVPNSILNAGDVFITQQSTSPPTILQLDESLEESVSTSENDDLATIALPMQLMDLEDAGITDVGRQRSHNEDNFGIETNINKIQLPKNRSIAARGLYILCDGMGGHDGGDVASELAVSKLRQYFQTHWDGNQLPTQDIIHQGVIAANQAIYEINQKGARSGVGRMGTTLVLLLIQDTKVAVAHVGDSRLYRLTRKGGLEQITVDHEVGQREIARGVERSIAYGRPDAYQLTQALGPRDENSIDPSIQFIEINEDTLFLLASDGLSDNDLLEMNWQTHLLKLLSSGADLSKGAKELIELANTYNGHDNITAVLVRAKVRPNLEGR
jgi:protein phosphatase